MLTCQIKRNKLSHVLVKSSYHTPYPTLPHPYPTPSLPYPTCYPIQPCLAPPHPAQPSSVPSMPIPFCHPTPTPHQPRTIPFGYWGLVQIMMQFCKLRNIKMPCLCVCVCVGCVCVCLFCFVSAYIKISSFV